MDFVISDTHFDHGNIIDYCDRPFDSAEEMNEALVANWNAVVGDDDEVIFLGDLTMANDFGEFASWLERLNGTIQFVLGDHDEWVMPSLDGVEIRETYQFEYEGVPFYCVHDPEDAPGNWRGWVLHGHHHNNWPDRFPFVYPDERRVNVSVELIGYEPLGLPTLLDCLTRFTWLDSLPDDVDP
ncbi:metallophosphoesterase [Halorussus lipolyticus]|uniref:metallophosphoesterase n=1 Tax=Halorussus lipolyticus TaxID=3034024 RepID=UPI0023E8E2A7|nr:metallophosphoesterase [Halorussus sp. DT80]